jgi:hypothetical protein
MTKNEIKKKFYKDNPKANLIQIFKGLCNYVVHLDNNFVIQILIPLSEMGDALFYPEMDAKLLIRWLQD